jgi:hypothetical protein
VLLIVYAALPKDLDFMPATPSAWEQASAGAFGGAQSGGGLWELGSEANSSRAYVVPRIARSGRCTEAGGRMTRISRKTLTRARLAHRLSLTILLRALALACLSLARSSYAGGAPPLSFSGVMQAASGTPLTAQQSVIFRLWPAATGGSALCVSTGTVNPDATGAFRLELDPACTAAVMQSSSLWSELQVGTQTLARSRLSAVPFAAQASRSARTVVSFTAADGGVKSSSVGGVFCGLTSPTTGNVVASDGIGGIVRGYRAAKQLCELTCAAPSAHMCSSHEAVTSWELGAPLDGVLAWVRGAQSAMFTNNGTAFLNDCLGYTTEAAGNMGTDWDMANNLFINVHNCASGNGQSPLPVMCCD